MYRKTKKVSQQDMFSSVKSHLPIQKVSDLEDENGWHNSFRREVYQRIDEDVFSCLFSGKKTGRPNASISRLVSMMVLKEGEGWTDRQLFESCRYNLKTMQAIGIFDLNENIPSESTYYDFKSKLVSHEASTGKCLLSEVFAHVTRGQINEYNLNCGKIRMDSKLIQSNIRKSSRLALIVEVTRSFCNQLSEEQLDKVKSKKTRQRISMIIGQTTSNFCYGLSNYESNKELIKMGLLLRKLVNIYSDTKPHNYEVLYSVYTQQYEQSVSPAKAVDKSSRKGKDDNQSSSKDLPRNQADKSGSSDPVEKKHGTKSKTIETAKDSGESVKGKASKPPSSKEAKANPSKQADARCGKGNESGAIEKKVHICPKKPKDIPSNSIQSPHDTDAEYRTKQKQVVRGLVLNVTEACDVLSNQETGLSNLPKKTPLHLIVDIRMEGATHTDCAFFMPAIKATAALTQQEITVTNADGGFDSVSNRNQALTNPLLENATVAFSKSKGGKLTFKFFRSQSGHVMVFDLQTKALHKAELITKKDGSQRYRIKTLRGKKQASYRYFSLEEIDTYILQKDIHFDDSDMVKQRANVEATIRQVTCKLDGGKKSRYRGKARMSMAAYASALFVNCTRIAKAFSNRYPNSSFDWLIKALARLCTIILTAHSQIFMISDLNLNSKSTPSI